MDNCQMNKGDLDGSGVIWSDLISPFVFQVPNNENANLINIFLIS